MNRYVALQVLGILALALGGQGAIRLLVDHTDGGLVSWVPGGFVAWLVIDLVAVGAGIALAAWAQSRARSRAGA